MRRFVLVLAIVAMMLLPTMRVDAAEKEKELHCLYNPANKEYLYTIDENEKRSLEGTWEYKGVVCTLPVVSDTPVYRMLDPILGIHLYTSDYAERLRLVQEQGWKLEGPAFYVDDKQTTPVYRLFNPLTGEHRFSAKGDEILSLENAGWIKEGVAFYGLKAGGKEETVRELDVALADSMVGPYSHGNVEIIKDKEGYSLYVWKEFYIPSVVGQYTLLKTLDGGLLFKSVERYQYNKYIYIKEGINGYSFIVYPEEPEKIEWRENYVLPVGAGISGGIERD